MLRPKQHKQKFQTGGLTPQQMQDWNQFLSFVHDKGYEGSPALNNKDQGLGAALFQQYKQANPSTSIDYSVVPQVQQEMQQLRGTAQSFAQRHGATNADQIMQGISPVDGWFGSKTSQFRFPNMQQNTFQNSALVASKNLGLVNANLQPQAGTQNAPTPSTDGSNPYHKLTYRGEDGKLYYNDANGDPVKMQTGGATLPYAPPGSSYTQAPSRLIQGQNIPVQPKATAYPPQNRIQDALSKGLIAPPTGYGSAQQAYDAYHTPMDKTPFTYNPQAIQQGMDTTLAGLSFLSGNLDRSRQNQYLYNQQSLLGSQVPLPSDDYQPNPFSLYARFGGSLKKYKPF